MSLQAAVERQHYLKCCNANALVNSVMSTWNDEHLDNSITKVFKRLKPVLCNILEAKGGNDYVEMKRGKKYENIKLEDVILQMQKKTKILTIVHSQILWRLVTRIILRRLLSKRITLN